MSNKIFPSDFRIKDVKIQNFRGLTDISIQFDESLTVLIGTNGSGKTSILDAIAGMLSSFANASISPIYELPFKVSDIRYGEISASGELNLNVKYQFIDDVIKIEFEKVVTYLNEMHLIGNIATLVYLGDNSNYFVKVDDDEPFNLPFDINTPGISGDFLLAKRTSHWQLNVDLSELSQFELGKKEKQLSTRIQIRSKNNKLVSSVDIKSGEIPNEIRTFLDFSQSQNKSIPLLAYYSGGVSNTNFIQETNLSSELHSILKDTLTPSKFSFSLLVNWFMNKQRQANFMILKKFQEIDFKAINRLIENDVRDDEIRFLTKETFKRFREIIETDKESKNRFKLNDFDEMQLVKEAILNVMNNSDEKIYTEIEIAENIEIPQLRLTKLVNGKEVSLDINQLSAGERNLLALVGDIAIRLMLLNKKESNPLDQSLYDPLNQGSGIVLIDEIDLHLHPLWQRKVIPALRKTFPNIQFIVTTHSPLVVQSAINEKLVFINYNGESIHEKNKASELSYNAIMREWFNVQIPFTIETELLMLDLKKERETVIETNNFTNKFREIIEKLSSKSIEIEGIARREVRYIEHLIQKEF